MKLEKLSHDPSALVNFFQDGLETLGAVCERSWHDRLQVVAEGAPARLWHPEGALLETEIEFLPADASGPRQAEKEVFPGCPLTFHLAEALFPSGLAVERLALEATDAGRLPAVEVTEKLWHAQKTGTTRWKPTTPFKPGWHFSLVALARCEIQAIDQHWSLHRLAVSLPDGEPDEALAGNLGLLSLATETPADLEWPQPDPPAWEPLLKSALERELAAELEPIRVRQENYLRRELERIDTYFEHYEQELRARHTRPLRGEAKIKLKDRLAAAEAEHARRRQDQVQRHEIRILPHLDALMIVAEPAWAATVSFVQQNEVKTQSALFVPRSRRWSV